MIELLAKICYKKIKNKPQNKTRTEHTVFALNSNKKGVTKVFYLSFFIGLMSISFALLINFDFINIEPLLNVRKSEFVFALSVFSSMAFINHFTSFHESLAHWDEKTKKATPNEETNNKQQDVV